MRFSSEFTKVFTFFIFYIKSAPCLKIHAVIFVKFNNAKAVYFMRNLCKEYYCLIKARKYAENYAKKVKTMQNNKNDLPTGLAMALAQNRQALFYYSQLDAKAQTEVARRAKSVNSKEDMARFVDEMAKHAH